MSKVVKAQLGIAIVLLPQLLPRIEYLGAELVSLVPCLSVIGVTKKADFPLPREEWPVSAF